jgi:dihydrofolate synthase/folylpolyglutamate synthase
MWIPSTELILTKSIHPRAADPHELVKKAGHQRAQVCVVEDVPSALWQALTGAHPDDLICITGSLFVVAEARAAWLDAQGIDFERDPTP